MWANRYERAKYLAFPAGTWALALALILCNAPARAQYLVTTPSAPTNATPVTIIVSNPFCDCPTFQVPIARTGFTFDIPIQSDCIGICGAPNSRSYSVGLLEPGTYTVRLANPHSTPEVIGTFVVAAAPVPVPALNVMWAAALVLALIIISLLALRNGGT